MKQQHKRMIAMKSWEDLVSNLQTKMSCWSNCWMLEDRWWEYWHAFSVSSLPRRKYKKKMLKVNQNPKKEDRSQGDHMNPLFKYFSSMHKKSMENKNNKIGKMLPNCFFHDIESNI